MIDCMNMHTAEMRQPEAIRVPDSSVDLPTVLISCISFSHHNRTRSFFSYRFMKHRLLSTV